MRIGIVVADFHDQLAEKMLEAARKRAEERDVDVHEVRRVHGSYDTPLPVQSLLESGDVDGVVVLGAVVEGETQHDEMIFQSTVKTLQELSLEHRQPVALGITGPGMTWDQARERVHYAASAVDACVRLVEGGVDG